MLLFGTAGVPLSTKKRSTIEGVKRVRELGLDAMEIEFVRGVKMGKEMAEEVRKVAEENKVALTAHGPYYINLNSKEKAKVEKSKLNIYQTAVIAYIAGGTSITFHSGYYMDMKKEKVYEIVKENLKDVLKRLEEEGVKIWVRPELTGKPTQFGDLDELIRLSQELEGVLPCIDFAHLHARYNGKYNSIEEWREVLSKLEKGLGREVLKNMHIHMSGINYSEKGERNHLNLEDSDLRYKDLLKVWKEFKIEGIVISESPNIEGDALLLKETFKRT
ncbi:hypothetical protein DRN62_00445 [Nanoarchaeota archaeon]|nr:MAG: hypothetical protein DRN62_00445 [Nanoarchaeota archaeon]